MTSRDILKLCFGNLRRRKTRTILSVVGVVIGTCAIVIMMSIGIGLSAGFQEQIESFGNLHLVQVYGWGGGESKLDDKTLAKIERIDGVSCVSPIMSVYTIIGNGHMKTDNGIIGMTPEMMGALNLEPEQGRIFNSSDKAPLLFGKAIAASFYDPRKQQYSSWDDLEPKVDVLSKFVITNDYNYGTNKEGESDPDDRRELVYIDAQGVGLLANEYDEYSYSCYTSIEFAKELKKTISKANGESQGGGNPQSATYDQAYVYVDDINKVSKVCDAIRTDYQFSTYSLNDMLEEMNKIARLIEGVLGGIGAVSLLVAAIGIANTMVMSVYERTREISVMKVIGASLKDIKKMFLIEAGMIGFIGGFTGLIISYTLSFVANKFILPIAAGTLGIAGSRISIIPIWLALAALCFSAFIGVVSGYSPAKRAMNLSVLEGLKNE